METINEILPGVINNSFAIFVAIYFMYRMEKKLDQFSNKMNDFSTGVEKLSKTILLLVINESKDLRNGNRVGEEAQKMYDNL